jgi:hypothetical protein
MHAAIVLLVLTLTYVGMAAGRIAWLQVDRPGIALLAVIALLASGAMALDDFASDVDLPAITFLFAMVIISAQFAESGFIDRCARTITDSRRGTAALLALTIAIGERPLGHPRHRHPGHRDRPVADRRSSELRLRSPSVCHRARRGDQCGLGRDLDREPTEHPDRVTRPARERAHLRRICPRRGPDRGPVARLCRVLAGADANPAAAALGSSRKLELACEAG